ncbi:hypothetical protein ACQPZF_04460 [Actinosynnema sp. CS-041913]|uniref:hypothetical protein n=1 Tax=Actinosynnema sp. CS-041913 TaxID=3239917 RepID=UPI003D9459AF
MLTPGLRDFLELPAPTRQRAEHVAAVDQLAALSDERRPGAKAVPAGPDNDIALAASRLGRAVAAKLGGSRVASVRAVRTTIRVLDKTISDAVRTHPYSPLSAALPCIGTVNLGQVFGGGGPILEREGCCSRLAAETGTAPVTQESGSHRQVDFRDAVNRRVRRALTVSADNSRHGGDWAAAICNDARARGDRYSHAVRVLARAWLRAGRSGGSFHAGRSAVCGVTGVECVLVGHVGPPLWWLERGSGGLRGGWSVGLRLVGQVRWSAVGGVVVDWTVVVWRPVGVVARRPLGRDVGWSGSTPRG